MKKIILIFGLLLLVLSGCSKQPEEEETKDVPYITFVADSFDLEWGSEFDPLSDTYIKDTNGEVSFEADFRTTEPGEYVGTYTVTSLTDPDKHKEYKVTFVVGDKVVYQFKGYPEKLVGFVSEDWDKDFDLNPSWTDDKVIFLIIYLYPEETKQISFHLAETELSESIGGTYTYLGDNKYEFKVYRTFLDNTKKPEGPYIGYFVIEDNRLYYMGDNKDFDNFKDYPYLER